MATEFVRVTDIATGHHITIPRTALDPAAHRELKSNPLDRNGNPRPAKYKKPLPTAAPTSGGEATEAATTTEANKEAKK